MTWLDGSWDIIHLNGQRLPGRVAELVITPERDIKKSQSPGTDGPDLKDQGYKGAGLELTQEIYRAADATAMVNALRLLTPQQTGGIAVPIPIIHPIAAALNVPDVYVEKLSVPMPKKGRWQVKVKMAQWFPESKDTKQGSRTTDDGGPFDSGGVPPPDPAHTGASFP
jgi:hypothetical protein